MEIARIASDPSLNAATCGCQRPLDPPLGNLGTISGPVDQANRLPAADAQANFSSVIGALIETLQTTFQGFFSLVSGLLTSSEAGSSEASPPATTPSTDAAPTAKTPAKEENTVRGKPLKETGLFLWKPISSKDQNLCVYLPPSTGVAKKVKILSPDGKTVLATATYSGKTGSDRPQYRFNKPGSEFPDGAIVQITKRDGSVKEVVIKNTEKNFRH